ncbi:2-oxoglutarate dehydrogenase E1 component [Candidatus Nucleicultrix amoebiphila]|jgi:2-oxoglutarate dehydrogenase E1 component|uniref:2-oxoglutarate dehydrogenase E1 component n=1 Tax=Candidatus Nucleicultrix amoebiphila FS5 TaxID=1414854 RepID=A0A1W6N2H1_9PROT|nr:2-oxoglutarate dehydrogenase E1 component [Candidatus Nucleicultrix amoebiphila]ARN84070.1 2-oxoglutarate dehydrogenase [Candidatus Nucleicultrix amoebiphila FS5]
MKKNELLSSIYTGNAAIYLESMFAAYLRDKDSIDSTWREFFEGLGDNPEGLLKDILGASWSPRKFERSDEEPKKETKDLPKTTMEKRVVSEDVLQKTIKALEFIQAYRARGHLNAILDPLELTQPIAHPELNPKYFGFSEEEYDIPITIGGIFGREKASIRELETTLKTIYSGTIGFEYTYILNVQEREWLQNRIERIRTQFSIDQKTKILKNLISAESFERFLQVKFTGAKRFGLEGGETLMPGLESILQTLSKDGTQDVFIGMAHRGRLNVIVNLIGWEPRSILAEFQGQHGEPNSVSGSGDVKYHLGVSKEREVDGHKMHLALLPNPSHLEFINPVVMGKVRGLQTITNDASRSKTQGVLIHGDAAFAGQGIVAETLLLSQLEGYTTGGTIHIIINNQIGFTASPNETKSSVYCSDLAKMIDVPVFHVNGDDPEAVVWVSQLAAEYRQTFKKDVFIDLICYRRFGHNEMDEPSFTQPLMYSVIRQRPSIRERYQSKLKEEGSYNEAEITAFVTEYESFLQSEFEAAKTFHSEPLWLKGSWQNIQGHVDLFEKIETGVEKSHLEKISRQLSLAPEDFNLNPKLNKLLKDRMQMFETGEGIDWSMGEALAFGTLLTEGRNVRLSGQDSARGTFTQRHAVYSDQTTKKNYAHLNHIQENQGIFEVINSPLSESGVMGFELGYSYADPMSLVLWEGQFGDFANGAQVIIDQFLSAGQAKWLRLSGLVLLLPHSYDGQGPEHTSARLERYLQLCAEHNMIVANCSTPANYFHLLRRQIHGKTRRPLIIMTPKALLRHPKAVSKINDMGQGTVFQEVIPDLYDKLFKESKIKRVILCSGKVYYDLLEEREKRNINNIALIRLEQFYPFPEEHLIKILTSYTSAELIWCQEEPRNMGAWHFLDRRLEAVLEKVKMNSKRPIYVGRPDSASPATGYSDWHNREQKKLINEALSL